MFFLLRSAICIGLVVAALPNEGTRRTGVVPGGAVPGGTVPTGAMLRAAGTLCRATPEPCVALLREGLKAGSAEALSAIAGRARPAPSRDSLSPADRRPQWSGPQLAAND